jgi:hypothetical protein
MTSQPNPGIWDDAEIISIYTRAAALEDGTLVDVSEAAREKGFRYPVAITTALHTRLEPDEYEQSQGQSYLGRLHDVLWMAYLSTRRAATAVNHLAFQVIVAERRLNGRGLKPNTLTLWATVDGGDDGKPVITIGFPDDF